MRRFEKSYILKVDGIEKGRYTTIDGCHAAAKRRGFKDYTIEQIKF